MDSYIWPHFEVKCLRTLVEQCWCWWNGWETFLPSQHKIGFLRSWTFTVPFNQPCTSSSDSLRYWSDFLIFLKKTVRGINDGHDQVSQKRVFLVFFSWNGSPHVPSPHVLGVVASPRLHWANVHPFAVLQLQYGQYGALAASSDGNPSPWPRHG